MNHVADNKTSILVVDDTKIFGAAVAEVLNSAGYSVLQAGSLQEAEQYLDEHGDVIGAVFWDNYLPDGEAHERPDLLARAPAINISSTSFGDGEGYVAEIGTDTLLILETLKKLGL